MADNMAAAQVQGGVSGQPIALRVDVVSDVMCPWCLIGWLKFQRVIEHYRGLIDFDVRWRPFELNPDMPAEGVDAAEYLGQRYGITKEQSAGNRRNMAEAAQALGFEFHWGNDFRMRNSFNAHRLLSWAEAVDDARASAGEGRQYQTALKMALFRAHFAEEKDVNDKAVLVDAARQAGLDADKALRVLESDDYGDVVREEQAHWRGNGVNGVPAFILDGRMMVPGAQEPEVFMRVIDRKILAPAD